MADTEWQIATQTHRGNVRKINEDSIYANRNVPLLVVADGMGGHEAGEIASKMLVDALAQLKLEDNLSNATRQIQQTVTATNEKIRDYARTKLDGKTIGTTVAILAVTGNNGACLWAGDSRIYRLRDNEFVQLSEDHSLVAEMVRNGEISAEEAIKHPSSNIITRAVGASPQIEVDVKTFPVKPQDTFLLCSDGLYNEVARDELANALAGDDIVRNSNQLLKLCLNRPARDNVSFIIGRISESSTMPADATLTYFPE